MPDLGPSTSPTAYHRPDHTHAIDFVRHPSQRVIPIDGQRLADLMIEHNVGVRVSRTVEFKRLDEDFFTEEK